MDDKGARDKLEQILNQREYQVYYEDSQGFISKMIETVQQWILDQLAKLFPAIGTSTTASSIVFISIVVLGIVILAISLYLVARTLSRKRIYRDHKPLESMSEINWSFEKHLQESKKQEDKGEYSLATRHLFLALLLYFHNVKWLEARIWKTNWEYYEELTQVNQQSAKFFYEFVRFFDQITYGEREVKEEEYQHYQSEVQKWLEDNKKNVEIQ